MKLLIFDFDGTLGDSRRLIVTTMQETLTALGLPVAGEAACAATIGLPLEGCFFQLLNDEALAAQCADLYRYELFPKNNVPGAVPPFPGVVATLHELHRRGLELAVASSRATPSLMQLLGDMDVLPLFSSVVSTLDVAQPKPAPDMVLKILADTAAKPSDTMMVGDATYDMLMGRAAGCATCGVTYGNGTREELARVADSLIDRFPDLLRLL